MRYANEATHLLPQGSTTRTLPQEYHTNVTTGQEYHTNVTTGVPHARYHRTVLHAHVTTGQMYHTWQYHTIVTTGQCHTLVTTEQYHMLLPHDITTRSISYRTVYHMIITTGQTIPRSFPQYHTESVWYVWYSGTTHTGLIGILPQRSGRHYHTGHIDILPHRSDRHYHTDLIDLIDNSQPFTLESVVHYHMSITCGIQQRQYSFFFRVHHLRTVFCMVTPGTTCHITLSHGYHSQLFTLLHKYVVYRLRPVVSNIPVVFVW